MTRRACRLAPLAVVATTALAFTALACTGAVEPDPPTTPGAAVPVTAQESTPPEPATTGSADAASATTDEPAATATPTPVSTPEYETFTVLPGTRPHDVAPAPDGRVWYTAQRTGRLGVLDPATGDVHEIPLGQGSAPHGVIVGPDGAPWVTDGGLNAIVRVDPVTETVEVFPLDAQRANLNTATFDGEGVLWFTGQEGIYGRLDPAVGQVDVFDAPRGIGPYGIGTAPDGTVWLSSLAGSYIGRVDGPDELVVVDLPTADGGARRVWSDSAGDLWVTEWFAGNLARYDTSTETWEEFPLPGEGPRPYAVWVDETDIIWVSDFGSDALLAFDPSSETFTSFPYRAGTDVRQILGRSGEVWGAGSGTDTLVVLRTG